ncbi:MAG: hypothetical protein KatS3mg108_2387 [Isosphaeraceae bacterium]|jgi:uncharacterized membrane protein YbhN (UPF0104 family)|nr:MAG: hypothetical protein KatS3mg108_2387 [Isosphaeraceae bacterium]
MSDRRRGLWLNLALVALAFGLLGWTIHANSDKIREVMATRPDPARVGLAFVFYLAALVLTFVRWYWLVRALGLPFRFRDALRLGFIGNVFNLVIPGAVGGDLVKAAFLCREQARKTQAVASMVIDRGVGLLGLFLLAGVAGLFVLGEASGPVRGLIGLAWLAVVAGVAGLTILFTPALYRPLEGLVRGRGRFEAVFHEMVALASAYRSRVGMVITATALALVSHAVFVLAFTLVDHALYPASAPSLGRHLVIVPLVLFTTAVPLPFGALGLSEIASGALFDLVQFPNGAVAMMGYRVITYLGAALSALFYVANAGQVKQLRRDAESIEHELEEGSIGSEEGEPAPA